MAQPSGSITPSDFGYIVTTTHDPDDKTSGEWLYFGHFINLMPKSYAVVSPGVRRQKLRVWQLSENTDAAESLYTEYRTTGESVDGGSITTEYEQTDDAADWLYVIYPLTADTLPVEHYGSTFNGHSWEMNAAKNPRVAHCSIRMSESDPCSPVVDAIAVIELNEKIYSGDDYSRQDRSYGAGRVYNEHCGFDSHQIMKTWIASLNRIAYVATQGIWSTPLFGEAPGS